MKKGRQKTRHRKRKCRNCGELYQPDSRNRRHQKYCSESACQRESKRVRQEKWTCSEKGRNYFQGSVNVQRVQEWRKAHPGYWKRKGPKRGNALQDDCSAQRPDGQRDMHDLRGRALQDVLSPQPALIAGLIASLTGNALQDDIVESSRRFILLGQDILGRRPGIEPKGGHDDEKTYYMPREATAGAAAVQLGGSPPGAGRLY